MLDLAQPTQWKEPFMGRVLDFPPNRPAHPARAMEAPSPGKPSELIETAQFSSAVFLLARSFAAVYESLPWTAALFATQQRRLLCHAALSDYFLAVRRVGAGLTRNGFGSLARQYGIASRNTAYAFFDEALRYNVIRPVAGSRGGPSDEVGPTHSTLSMLIRWYSLHFQALDLIDGGGRAARFLMEPQRMLILIEPLAAHALLTSREVRSPGPLHAIFASGDTGGFLMDRLIAGIDPETVVGQGRLLTNVSSISSLASSFGLSRAHISGKLAAAESIGAVGWSGRRGRSHIWISSGFYQEYARAHACKLSILADAFTEACSILASFPIKSAATSDS